MASITYEKATGRRTVQFYVNTLDADGKPTVKRRSLRLGKATKKTAEEVRRRVESILSARLAGTDNDSETAAWIGGLGPVFRKRLVQAGLAQPAAGKSATHKPGLKDYLDTYAAGRTDVKVRTQLNYRQSVENLIRYFGEDKALDAITEGDAEEYQRWLTASAANVFEVAGRKIPGRGLGDNTARRHCGRAKQFFRFAAKKRYITANPFAELKGTSVQKCQSRDLPTIMKMTAAVFDACPDAEWRVLFALCRFGGLRCPSEVLTLRWVDVDWERDRITVTSPKTAHILGKGTRVIPIFAELRPHLEEAWQAAPEGAEFVITRYRDSNTNLRTQFTRIIRRAGVEPWPQLFHSLRAARQTELADRFPIQAVCAWIGNSEKIAEGHYLEVTEDHFEKAVRFPVLQGAELHRTEPQASNQREVESPVFPGYAAPCDSVRCTSVPPRGVEPLSSG